MKQNLKDFSQNYSPLPPPIEDKKPALPSKWSFSDVDHIAIDETDTTYTMEPPKVDNPSMKQLLIESRPRVDHEAFDLDTHKKPVNTVMKKHVDEMVKNGTPYLAMHLCPVHKLELSENFTLNEETKSKFPFMEKIEEIFCDGIMYDEKLNLEVKKADKEKPINIKYLMKKINQLELDEDDDIEQILSEFI